MFYLDCRFIIDKCTSNIKLSYIDQVTAMFRRFGMVINITYRYKPITDNNRKNYIIKYDKQKIQRKITGVAVVTLICNFYLL